MSEWKNKPIVFDGNSYAKEKERALIERVWELKRSGITPKLVTFLTTEDRASETFVSLKKRRGHEIGVDVDVIEVSNRKPLSYLKKIIQYYNMDESVHGIMVQLPLRPTLKSYTDEIIKCIDPKKDVDGLRDDSPFISPVVKAVWEIREIGRRLTGGRTWAGALVIGAKGRVGRKIVKYFKKRKKNVRGVDKSKRSEEYFEENLDGKRTKYKVVISAIGIPGIVKSYYILKKAVVIDVGAPKGDVDFYDVSRVAGFMTPVPGGVGPVTIACLLENLVEAAGKKM